MNELNSLPRLKYDESSSQLARMCSVDTPRDMLDPKLHIVRRTFGHRREKYQIALASVIHCENALDIDPTQRWTLDNPMCLDAFKASAESAYRRALDSLSSAVIQRILELHKMGLPGTCKYYQ